MVAMRVGKLYQKIVVALLFSVLISTGCDAKAGSSLKIYKLPIISDVETVVSASKEVPLRGRSVRLTLLHEAARGKPIAYIHKSHSPAFVESMVKKTSRVMTAFLKERGVTIKECRGSKYNLIITVVSKNVLQDDNRFRNFYRMKYGVERLVGRTLYGYYDSTPEIANNSSILVTDMGVSFNETVLAHELAHYWWDRLCVGAKIPGESEAFAQAFDSYYQRSLIK
jgi:hypothetical protein